MIWTKCSKCGKSVPTAMAHLNYSVGLGFEICCPECQEVLEERMEQLKRAEESYATNEPNCS